MKKNYRIYIYIYIYIYIICVLKKKGNKSHFFTKFNKSFYGKNNSQNTLNLSTQQVSDDKYLKLYKIKSNIVDYNNDTLENSLSFTHENEDLFFGLNANMFPNSR